MILWIDGDSCHRLAMAMAFKADNRENVSVKVLADRDIPLAVDAGVEMIRLEHGSGAVDDVLSESVNPGDAAVTRDLELALRLLGKGVTVLNDRGRIWNERDLKRRIEEAELMKAMRAGGMVNKGMPSYDEDVARDFALALDKVLS